MGENTASIGCLSDAFSFGLWSIPMEKPHSAVRCSNMPLPFRRYQEAATGCRDQFVVACLGSFVFVAVVVVVLWSRPVSHLVSSFFLCAAACLLAPRHGVFRLSKSDIFRANAPMQWFPERTISSQATCCNVLNNDAPIALYLY